MKNLGRHEGSGRGLDVIVTRGMCRVRVSVSARGSGVGCLSLIHIHQTLINHRPGTPTASHPLGSDGKRSWRTERKKKRRKMNAQDPHQRYLGEVYPDVEARRDSRIQLTTPKANATDDKNDSLASCILGFT